MKKAFFFFIGFIAFALAARAQDYSGRYNANSDIKPDGVYENNFPATVDLRKVSTTRYEGTHSTGRAITVDILTRGSKVMFMIVDSGNGYLAVGSGRIEGTTFYGTFTDATNKGNFKWVRQ